MTAFSAIVDDIQTTLEGILIDSGFLTDAGLTVGQVIRDPGEVGDDERPCIDFAEADDQPDPEYYALSNLMRQRFHFYVLGHTAADDETTLAEALSNLREDLRNALETDRSRGGNAVWTKFLGSSSTHGLNDRPGVGSILQKWEVAVDLERT